MLFSDARRSVEGLSKALKGQRGGGREGVQAYIFQAVISAQAWPNLSSDKLDHLAQLVLGSMSGFNKRDAAKAEKEADVVVQSLRSAGDAAVATTLAGITNVLKANRPLMYHIHALLHNEEWKAVLMATAMGDGEEDGAGASPSSGAKPGKSHQKLRATVKKFEHLARLHLPLSPSGSSWSS